MPPRKKPVEPAAVLPGQMPLPLKANPGCCEEASTLSRESYIPCNRPAAYIVGWKDRSEAPIRMCDQCEFHNVKNRGGVRIKVYDGPKPETPPIDHNSNVTDNDLIAENHKLEDLIKAAQAKFDEWAKPHKARIAEIESALRARLLERGADSTKTDAGTAYFSNIMNTKVENIPLLFDFVADNWEEVGADVKISVPVGKVREHMDEHDGRPPPGISISYFSRLNIKRS